MVELFYIAGSFVSGVGITTGLTTLLRRDNAINTPPTYKCQCKHETSFHERIVKRNGDNVEITFGACQSRTGNFENYQCGCQGYIGDVPPGTPAMILFDPEEKVVEAPQKSLFFMLRDQFVQLTKDR